MNEIYENKRKWKKEVAVMEVVEVVIKVVKLYLVK